MIYRDLRLKSETDVASECIPLQVPSRPCATRQVVDPFGTTVKDSLLSLDISNNSIQHVEGFPLRARIMLSYNSCPLNFSRGVLTEAEREIEFVVVSSSEIRSIGWD